MAILTFNAVILYGNDRGSVWPFRLYEVDLPKAKHEAYLNLLNTHYQRAMENIVGELDGERNAWVENANTYLDETERMLRRDRWVDNEENPDLAPASAVKAAQQVLLDTLESRAFTDTFWEEDGLIDFSFDELLAASKRKVGVEIKPIITERIALGTLCYCLTGSSYSVAAAAAPFTGPTEYTPERSYVPVSEVEAEKAIIEVFPLPFAFSKHQRWFARVKDSKKLEALGVKRADAIFRARILAAHKRFWA